MTRFDFYLAHIITYYIKALVCVFVLKDKGLSDGFVGKWRHLQMCMILNWIKLLCWGGASVESCNIDVNA